MMSTQSTATKATTDQELQPAQLIVLRQDTAATGTMLTVPSLATGLLVVGQARSPRVLGVAYFDLPDSKLVNETFNPNEPARFVDLGLPKLVDELADLQKKLAAGSNTPTAPLMFRLVGGSQLFQFGGGAGNPLNVGTRNAIAARATLGRLGKMVIAADVGGNKARRVTIDASLGEVVVEEIGGRRLKL